MKQQLARLFFPYGSERRVFRGPVQGTRFIVEDGIGVNYAIGTDAAAPRHFTRWVRPGMTVYDVSANKGQMALLFANLVGPTGRVVAFEPAPPSSPVWSGTSTSTGLATSVPSKSRRPTPRANSRSRTPRTTRPKGSS